ncbi:LysR family transcriptional regulator [Paenibacillus sp. SI92]|uniref:LysR family transcriptional regulator n=1 Tax=Paenibacillus sp. SI92 TaxID=3163027 RepID=UPI003465BF18
MLQLKYFQTVARREHITQAAKELNIAQPSLSQTIARLEEDLGVALFYRHGRNIRLNESGKTFLEHVDRVFIELEKGKEEARKLAGKHQEVLSIATIHLPFLPQVIANFVAKQPGVHFRFHQGCYPSMRKLLEAREIDLCISAPQIDLPSVSSAVLLTEEIRLLIPKGHRLAGRGQVKLSEVASEPFVSLKEGYGLRESTDEFCQRAGFTPNIVFEVEEPRLMQTLVRSGIGISFIPELFGLNEPDNETESLTISDPECTRTLSLSWLNRTEQSPAFERFRLFIINYFNSLRKQKQIPGPRDLPRVIHRF